MPEAQKNTNETAEKRKRIFSLFKRFHPDKFVTESVDIQKVAEEISKVLSGILSLNVNEPIPRDLRAEPLRIVFIDDEGILVGSTKRLTVDSSQEKFISDLEYILKHKSFPVDTKASQAKPDSKSNSSANFYDGDKKEPPSRHNQSRDNGERSRNFSEEISALKNVTEAQNLLKTIYNLYTSDALSSSQRYNLETAIKAKVFSFINTDVFALKNVTEAQSLLKTIYILHTSDALSLSQRYNLETAIQAKVFSFINTDATVLKGITEAQNLLKTIYNLYTSGALSSSQRSNLETAIQAKVFSLINTDVFALKNVTEAKSLLKTIYILYISDALSLNQRSNLENSLNRKFNM